MAVQPSDKMQKKFEQWIQRLIAFSDKQGCLPRVALSQNKKCELEERQISGWLSRMQQLHRQLQGGLPHDWLERLQSVKGIEERIRNWNHRLPISSALVPPGREEDATDGVVTVSSETINSSSSSQLRSFSSTSGLLSISIRIASEIAKVQKAALDMIEAAPGSMAHRAALETAISSASAAKDAAIKMDSIASKVSDGIDDVARPLKRARYEVSPPGWAIEQLETNLSRMRFRRQQRYNVARNKDKSSLPHGCSFGFRWDYRGNIGISSSTFRDERHTNFFKFLCDFVKWFKPGFKFSTAQVNSSYQCMLHVDRNNVGPSLIITVGRHTGGELWIHRRGKVEVHNIFAEFDGNEAHATCPFEGERFCIVFFTAVGYEKANERDKMKLVDLGVPLPEPGRVRKDYPPAAELLQEAMKALPPELFSCVKDADGDEEGEGSEAEDEPQDEGEASDVEDQPQDEEFQRVLLRSGQSSQNSHGRAAGDDNLEEVLRLSLEEYKESQIDTQKEQAELEEALRLSGQVAYLSVSKVAAQAISDDEGVASSSSSQVFGAALVKTDDNKLQELCNIAGCSKARAEKALADACGDQNEALLALTRI